VSHGASHGASFAAKRTLSESAVTTIPAGDLASANALEVAKITINSVTVALVINVPFLIESARVCRRLHILRNANVASLTDKSGVDFRKLGNRAVYTCSTNHLYRLE
jgi:hypothetical protein